jgi:Tol biopolymer transport system component
VASTGALAFLQGEIIPYADAQLVVVDRQGRVSPLDAPKRSYSRLLSLSPDGSHLAVSIRGLTEHAIWLYDRERGTLSKLTSGGEASWPRWTPDGQRIAFRWFSQGVPQLAWQRADGASAPEVLARDAGVAFSWSPDGRHLALVKDDDIWVATVENGRAVVEPLTRTPEREGWPEFSPDGRWLAYASNESGRFEVYVQPYPGPGPRQQVSLEGGTSPAWTDRELFYVSLTDRDGGGQMTAVDVRPGPNLTLGKPRRLFEFSSSALRGFVCEPGRCYAVAGDGQRFYTSRYAPPPPTPPVTHIRLIQNWTEELKAHVPSGTGR